MTVVGCRPDFRVDFDCGWSASGQRLAARCRDFRSLALEPRSGAAANGGGTHAFLFLRSSIKEQTSVAT